MSNEEFKKGLKNFNDQIEKATSGRKAFYYEYEKKVANKIKVIAGKNGSIFIGNSLYRVKDGHIVTAVVYGDTNEIEWSPIYNEEYDNNPYCDADGWDFEGGVRILSFLGEYLKDKFAISSNYLLDKNVGTIAYFQHN